MHMHPIVFTVIALTCAASVYGLYMRAAIGFFSSELRDAHAHESVIIRSKTYSVVDGGVTGCGIWPTCHLRVLETAYARELALRSPIFGISGVDPRLLNANTDKLKKATAMLADAQSDPTDAELVRTSLYPIAFLRTLATLEESRQSFVATGSDEDGTRYEAALEETAAQGQKDASGLQSAFVHYATTSVQFSMFGGTITTATLISSLGAIEKRMRETRDSVQRRIACVHGAPLSCSRGALEISLLPVANPQSENAKQGADNAREVRSILEEAYPPTFKQTRIQVSLASSTCVSMLEGPYYFLAVKPQYAENTRPLQFINVIMSAPTINNAVPIVSYFHNRYGATLVPTNPMAFYICPDIGIDLGTIRAVIATTELAKKCPRFAPQERAVFLSSQDLDERIARQYLRAVLNEVTATKEASESELNDTISVLNMFYERSGGLDHLVGEIATIDAGDAQARRNGVPFDVSAKTLFLTHTAFPSLFLGGNNSAGTTQLNLRNRDQKNFAGLIAYYNLRYSSIRATIPRKQIIHDLRAFAAFEQDHI